MNLGHWQKFQKFYIHSTPGGRNSAYFRSTGSSFKDIGRFSKFPYLVMKLGHWPNSRSFTSMVSKLSLVLLYRQGLLRYGPTFKIAIFGDENWPLAKVPEVAHILSRAAVSEILAVFQNCHIWA